MKRKLIFLDIDGTITMPGTPPSAETAHAVRTARDNGHLVFLCTGRSVFSIDNAVSEIGFDGGIYHAGGRVLLGNEEPVNRPLDAEKTGTLIRLLRDLGITFHLEAADDLFTHDAQWDWDALDLSKASTELLRQMQQRRAAYSKHLSDYKGQPIYKVSFMAHSQKQQEQLNARVPQWAKLVWFDNFFPDMPILAGEISDSRVTKATAMEAVCYHLGASAEDCIAFGDSMNDAEILKAAGLGIAMGNAAPEVKAIADMVCESCADDGIAKTLCRLKLI